MFSLALVEETSFFITVRIPYCLSGLFKGWGAEEFESIVRQVHLLTAYSAFF